MQEMQAALQADKKIRDASFQSSGARFSPPGGGEGYVASGTHLCPREQGDGVR